MTTIGTAVLQIIPSLLGVTEEIEKQLDGKAVDIQIKPKVDQRATEAAAKKAREAVEKQTTQVKVEPKVDARAAEKAGKAAGDAVTKGASAAVEKSSPGKDIAKVIVDGIADGVKGELRGGPLVDEFVEGLADGVKQGIDQGGVSKTILSTIGDGLKSGNVGKTIKDAVLPGIKDIGTSIRGSAADWSRNIGDSLRSGDIQGATDDIGNTVRNTTDIIANIGEAFGLQLGGVREFGDGSASALSDVASKVQGVITPALSLKGTFDEVGGVLETVLPRKAEKGAKAINAALALIVVPQIGKELTDSIDEWLKENHPRAYELNHTNTPDQLGQRAREWVDKNVFGKGREVSTGVPRGPVPVGQPLSPVDIVAHPPAPTRPSRPLDPYGLLPPGGYGSGGYTGNLPIDQIAGVVHGKEFVVNADATTSIENAYPGLLDYLNKQGKLPGYEGGGLVGPDVSVAKALAGIPYSQGNRTDCSGMVSRVILQSLGKSGGLMTTKTADKWLSALGFRSGTGGPGAITVGWYDRGPNPNDGHMAMTLSDGTHAEAGGRNRVFTLGGGARGGDDSAFDHHMFLALTSGKGPASGDGQISGEGPAIGGIPSTVDASPAPGGSGESSTGGFGVPSSLSGLAGMGLSNLGVTTSTQIGQDSQDRTFDIGGAASAAVGGQVSSALGVFGVNDSPGWLKGISTFVGGLSVSDASGKKVFDGSNIGGTLSGAGSLFGSAAPAAPPAQAPATLPDSAHGAQAGQRPGPAGPTYNIRTATVEDAFTHAQQQEKVRLAAKLDRY